MVETLAGLLPSESRNNLCWNMGMHSFADCICIIYKPTRQL